MMAFPLFLASESDVSWADTAEVLAWATGIPGLALSLYAAVLYVPWPGGRWRRGAETLSVRARPLGAGIVGGHEGCHHGWRRRHLPAPSPPTPCR